MTRLLLNDLIKQRLEEMGEEASVAKAKAKRIETSATEKEAELQQLGELLEDAGKTINIKQDINCKKEAELRSLRSDFEASVSNYESIISKLKRELSQSNEEGQEWKGKMQDKVIR